MSIQRITFCYPIYLKKKKLRTQYLQFYLKSDKYKCDWWIFKIKKNFIEYFMWKNLKRSGEIANSRQSSPKSFHTFEKKKSYNTHVDK